MITHKEKIAIYQKLRRELPTIKISDAGRLVVRQYEIEPLINFVYEVFKIGEKRGYEKIKRELKNVTKKAIINF